MLRPKHSGCKSHKFTSAMDEAIDYTLKTLGEDGTCLAKCIMDKYKELLISQHDVHDIGDSEYTNYKKY